MYMIFFVFHDPSRLDELLTAWQDAGISGATILESTGMYRQILRHVPMRYLFGDIEDDSNQTLISIVESREIVLRCLAAVEQIIGDLDQPHTGIFAAWPLEIVKGLDKPPVPPDKEV